MSHIWYHADRHEQWNRVTAIFFGKDLGLALAPKICPDQSQTFKEVNNRYLVGIYCCRKEKRLSLFWTGRFQVLQAMFVQSFAQKVEELTA